MNSYDDTFGKAGIIDKVKTNQGKNIRTFAKDEDLVSERRKAIVKSATQLFVRKGYLKTSTREIAEECGMGKGTLYHYIGKKEDILNMMSDTGMSWVKNLEEIATKLHQLPPSERLSIVIRTYLQYVDENQDFFVFWYQETKNLTSELRKNLFDAENSMMNMFKEILENGKSKGQFEFDDAEFIANDIVVLCDMWAFRRWHLRKKYTLESYTQDRINNILKTVGADKNDNVS